jgi:hypothetical protein
MPTKNPNLRPWKPGQSGNPAGRPRKRPISQAYDDLVQTPVPVAVARAMKIKPGSLWCEAIAIAAAREAISRGGTLSRKEIREAIEGKATQRIELRSDVRAAEFVVVYAPAFAPVPNDIKSLPEQPAERIIEVESVKNDNSESEDKRESEDRINQP